jgi:hypothetical protein
MKELRVRLVILFSIVSILGTLDCGKGNRQLQSITIVAAGGSSTETILNATETFSMSPTTETPAAVSWYLLGPGLPTPSATYSLTTQAFVLPCGGNTAIALAPSDPRAPNGGAIPNQVFQDLVTGHTTLKEGGFVAASMVGQLNC